MPPALLEMEVELVPESIPQVQACARVLQSWRYDTGGGKRPHRGTPGVIKDEAATAFVGNLPFSANEDDLSSHLSQAGKVVDVRMPQQEGTVQSVIKLFRVQDLWSRRTW